MPYSTECLEARLTQVRKTIWRKNAVTEAASSQPEALQRHLHNSSDYNVVYNIINEECLQDLWCVCS